MNSSDPAERAKAVYLMLLVTHPEIRGDPSQTPDEFGGGYVYDVTIGDKNVSIWIRLSDLFQSEKGSLASVGEATLEMKPGEFTDVIRLTVYKGAFQSINHLYHVIGHEGVHIYELATLGRTDEVNAYMWNLMHAYNPIPYPWSIGVLINKYRLEVNPNLRVIPAIVD